MSGASSAILGYRGGVVPVEANNGPLGGAQPYQVNLRHQRPEINLEAAFQAKHGNTFIDNMDFEFLKFLSFDELERKMNNLDGEMEKEIDELRKRYQMKRQPLIDAMESKRNRQQNF
jgi:serine/threonine kinase 3